MTSSRGWQALRQLWNQREPHNAEAGPVLRLTLCNSCAIVSKCLPLLLTDIEVEDVSHYSVFYSAYDLACLQKIFRRSLVTRKLKKQERTCPPSKHSPRTFLRITCNPEIGNPKISYSYTTSTENCHSPRN